MQNCSIFRATHVHKWLWFSSLYKCVSSNRSAGSRDKQWRRSWGNAFVPSLLSGELIVTDTVCVFPQAIWESNERVELMLTWHFCSFCHWIHLNFFFHIFLSFISKNLDSRKCPIYCLILGSLVAWSIDSELNGPKKAPKTLPSDKKTHWLAK